MREGNRPDSEENKGFYLKEKDLGLFEPWTKKPDILHGETTIL